MIAVETLEQIKARLEAALSGVTVDLWSNPAVVAQGALVVPPEHGLAVARWLREDAALALDFASNVTGVDWPDLVTQEKVKVTRVVEGEERVFEETLKKVRPGFLEVVYHLYSMRLKQGPVIIRLRTADRSARVELPSLTPVWRGCELQEREVFDLFGVRFAGHPDLRRILMWDGFQDYPMRKDYVEPDDYEYEPTPHDEVLEKAKAHYPPTVPKEADGPA